MALHDWLLARLDGPQWPNQQRVSILLLLFFSMGKKIGSRTPFAIVTEGGEPTLEELTGLASWLTELYGPFWAETPVAAHDLLRATIRSIRVGGWAALPDTIVEQDQGDLQDFLALLERNLAD